MVARSTAKQPFEEIANPSTQLLVKRPPETDDELWWWLRTVLGVTVSRSSCCPEHTPPFDLVTDMYFRRQPVIVVVASRGCGKSLVLAYSTFACAILQGVYATVLGGSSSQALNVLEISQKIWEHPYAPRGLLVKEPTRFDTYLKNGGHVRALMASSRSVRGQHPGMLCQPARSKVLLATMQETTMGELEIGQEVISRDLDANRWVNSMVSNKQLVGNRPVMRIECEAGVVECTPNHPIYTMEGWTNAGDITLDMRLGCLVGNYLAWAPIISISTATDPEPVYDITVDGTNCYLSGGVLMHNCIDEADELPDIHLLDAAQGMPSVQVTSTGEEVMPVTVISSTHHRAFGPMTAILERAEERNWKTIKFCWRCVLRTPDNAHGWMNAQFIKQKRGEMSERAFAVEFDLSRPSIEDSLLNPDSVERMWDQERGFWEGRPGEEIIVEKPQKDNEYVVGVDWAKKRDWTVVTAWRPDPETNHWYLVYFLRMNRLPWPEMITKVMEVIRQYPGSMAHDATGIGDVIGDMFPEEARNNRNIRDIVMRGEVRSQMFEDYVRAIEGDIFKAPRIRWAYEEMLYCRYEDLHAASGHPPDSIVAGAMAWLMRDTRYNWDLDISDSEYSFGPTKAYAGWVPDPTYDQSALGTGWKLG